MKKSSVVDSQEAYLPQGVHLCRNHGRVQGARGRREHCLDCKSSGTRLNETDTLDYEETCSK